MAKTFKLQVVAPDTPAISEEVTEAILPGELGEFGVMADHMSLLSTLKPGVMRVYKGHEKSLYFISGGFAEVSKSSLIVLADIYERSDEIDLERARNAKNTAQEQLSERKEGVNMDTLKHALARAEARIKTVVEAKSLKK